ncbi:putative metal-dependent hydrolase [Methylobacterium sp. BE186]|uniref:M48 family metallopeptidase n=1 Tax=Methylobacterium sp. BE186 TaxID=2817715 RepID=UPI0028552C81|nr:SprT family zinc-dependent metalloprotease [Methylobacterium sp. BE186]MDR7038198.1 putative metal-dependent hydrolase [Methylobacterium sp. BE186]
MPLALLRRPDPEHLDILHGGEPLRVSLRRWPAARRLTLRVSQATGEVILTLPTRTSIATAQRFVASHGGWIAARLARVPARVLFEPGASLPVRGVPHRIEHRGARSGATRLEQIGGEAVISVSCDPAFVGRRVRDWLQREVRADLAEAVARYTAALGQAPTRITIRDTRSRWGSCTARGELNFSWRLILAPPLVLDYLVAHEMAHLREMNHSQRFWSLLGDLCPHVDEAEAWLKRNGASLHRYG